MRMLLFCVYNVYYVQLLLICFHSTLESYDLVSYMVDGFEFLYFSIAFSVFTAFNYDMKWFWVKKIL